MELEKSKGQGTELLAVGVSTSYNKIALDKLLWMCVVMMCASVCVCVCVCV